MFLAWTIGIFVRFSQGAFRFLSLERAMSEATLFWCDSRVAREIPTFQKGLTALCSIHCNAGTPPEFGNYTALASRNSVPVAHPALF